jgi:hypothetical protein
MPQTPHVERHFTGSEVVRDIVIGMSDGLTVPFALAAGLSGIANSTAIVITGGWPRLQRPLHRRATHPQRDSDRADRRACSRRGLWPGQSNFKVRCIVSAFQF